MINFRFQNPDDAFDWSQKVGDYKLFNSNSMAKYIWQSKTVWLAIAQAIAGICLAVFSADPALQATGFGAVVKSVIDIWVRCNTSTSIVAS